MLGKNSVKIKNSRKGFTLIEMMVVTFVLGIGLIGALSFFNINLNNQFEAKNEVIAANLAQEGVDLVRNLRDYNQLKGNAWYENICKDFVSGKHKCITNKCWSIDFNSLTSHTCDTGPGKSTQYICLDDTGRYYQCKSSDIKTNFKREIDISACDPTDSNPNTTCKNKDLDTAGNYMKVIVTVGWNGRTTTATDILYNNSY